MVFAASPLPAFAWTLWAFSTGTPLTAARTLLSISTGALLASTRASGWIPRQQVGAVGVHSRRKLGVEDELAGRVELREVRQDAPADEEIPVSGRLGVAL